MSDQETQNPVTDSIVVKAFDVASAYDLSSARRILEQEPGAKTLEDSPLLVQVGSRKMVAVFDYGAVVFFDLSQEERQGFVERLNPCATRPNKTVSEDDFTLHLSAQAKNPEGTDVLFVKELNRDIALVVSTVLSRSVSIEFYEKLVADALAKLERPIASLQQTGKIPRSERGLTKNVGFALAVEHELAYILSAFDDPEIVWDGGKRIEELYKNLKREFDLEDRIRIIQQKVSIISRSSTFVISRIEGQRSQILEWIIILLIVSEILLFVFGKIG